MLYHGEKVLLLREIQELFSFMTPQEVCVVLSRFSIIIGEISKDLKLSHEALEAE